MDIKQCDMALEQQRNPFSGIGSNDHTYVSRIMLSFHLLPFEFFLG